MFASAGAGGDDDDGHGRRGGSGKKPTDEGHREPGKRMIVGNKFRRYGKTKDWVEELIDSGSDSDEEAASPKSQIVGKAGPNLEWLEKLYLSGDIDLAKLSKAWAEMVDIDDFDHGKLSKSCDEMSAAMDAAMEAMSLNRSAATSNPSPGSSMNIPSATSSSGGADISSLPSPPGNSDEGNDSDEDDKEKEV